ncbi:hypothetical protein AGDE_00079 [Angomonas deanei]|uniref:Uncharacterized protein n=1 Tax=Angomonas deanei TaxID=59799 RepID=A0A7G2C927_9TRYP|nr:hypothetical protein AGDE_00079 [Angomonas deanei]CAD2215357.1 hypothetical protein, conserved [Angomonas deanei]|eukprot:EPY43842.1 hypothetical protein AGDE_00079 [Angomonas deanei]
MLRRSTALLYEGIAAPIGKGRVVPLRFDSLKPAYIPKTFTTQFFVLGTWTIGNMMPNFILCFLIIAAANGGLSGAWPPDPHSLHP